MDFLVVSILMCSQRTLDVMKILYVAPKYDYGKPERGLSFEHYNFFDSLFNMGNDIIYFDYISILKKRGKELMNALLLDVVEKENPDLMFVFLFEYELDPKIISQISKSGRVVTLNWFADDHWRFDNYSRYWAHHFNWAVTTDFSAVPKYQSIGYENVILSQWACNHFKYRNLEKESKYDVSFVGQAYGKRRRIVEAIQKSDVNILIKGHGWEAGRADQEEMIEIFNTSKINLNLSNASVNRVPGWVNFLDRFWLYTPGVKRVWRKARLMLSLGSAKADTVFQIKGRNFEVPGCGGFLLTDYISGLENYYQPDKDIVCYRDHRELLEKIRYYLENEELRRQIARNGYHTTLEKHTYVHRFNQIFQKMRLFCSYSLDSTPGSCREIEVDI